MNRNEKINSYDHDVKSRSNIRNDFEVQGNQLDFEEKYLPLGRSL